MARSAATRSPGRPPRALSPTSDRRYRRRLRQVLDHATKVFCEKGYEGASMRDLSRAAGLSLAGLYHYFGSKERLLYLIQKHTFTTILERLKARLSGSEHPEQQIRVFIQNHLEYFLANQQGMKVLSHEDEALKNRLGAEIRAIKREYYRICVELMDALKCEHNLECDSRTAVMSLFGMMNWIYTWYNPRVDGSAEELALKMGDIFLSGVTNTRSRTTGRFHQNCHPERSEGSAVGGRAGGTRRSLKGRAATAS